MPHTRNPVAAATAPAAATMAPNLAATIFAAQVQDHERSAGPWHAEWPTLPTLQLVTSGALAAIVELAEGRGGDIRAGGKHRQKRCAPSGRSRSQEGRRRQAAFARGADERSASDRASQ